MTKEEIQQFIDAWCIAANEGLPFQQVATIMQCNLLLLILERLEEIAADIDSIETDVFNRHNR